MKDAELRGGPSELAEVIRRSPPPGLRWDYKLEATLTHATISRAVQNEALEEALR